MEKIYISHTDLQVSRMCMGTADLGSVTSQEDSFELLNLFYEHGGTFLDTAISYADWIKNAERSASEKTIGRWLKKYDLHNKIVVATKGGTFAAGTLRAQLSKEELDLQIEQSLRNLGLDTIDLYLLHRDDENRAVEEIMDTLFAHVDNGNLRYLGCSNWTLGRIKLANEYAEKCGRLGFVALSDRWSLAKYNPNSDPTMLDMDIDKWNYCKDKQLTAIPYKGLANGYLTYLATGANVDKLKNAYGLEINLQIADRAKKLARDKNVSATAIAMAYLRSQAFVTIPITAFSKKAQLLDLVEGVNLELSKSEIDYLNLL